MTVSIQEFRIIVLVSNRILSNYSIQFEISNICTALTNTQQLKTKQESRAIAKMTVQCALYLDALIIFRTPWLRPRLLSPQNFTGFCSDRPYECVQNLKSVALPIPDITENTPKFGEVLAMPTLQLHIHKKNSIGFPYRLFLYVHWFSRNFQLEFWVGLQTPILG